MFALNHIHLKSTDAKKAAAWYVNMLGAKLVQEGATNMSLDLGGLRVNIASPQAGQNLPKGSADQHLGLEHFGLETDDLEGLLAQLKPKGLEILDPLRTVASGLKIVFIRAPDDVRIDLMQLPH